MATQVFISHSTNIGPEDTDEFVHPTHRQFLTSLCEKLRAAKDKEEKHLFEVYVDHDNLKAGDPWRRRLLEGLGSCHAGIVLLNRKAIERSDWVHTEASILTWRKWLEPQFGLVVILLGQGSGDALTKTRKWDPLALSEIQFLAARTEFLEQELPGAAFDELLGELCNAQPERPETWYDALRNAVRQVLGNAFHIGDSVDARDRAKRIRQIEREAEGLLENGLLGMNTLLNNCGMNLTPEQANRLLDLIAPWWVNPCSSCLLAQAPRADHRRKFGYVVTGKQVRFTPKMYVQQQSAYRGPDFAWKVIEIVLKGGQQSKENYQEWVMESVRSSLKESYDWILEGLYPDEYAEEAISDEMLNAVVQKELSSGLPTFIALPNVISGESSIIDPILDAFPSLIPLQLVETCQQALAMKDCQVLNPLPTLKDEEAAHFAYLSAKRQVSLRSKER